MSYVSKKKLKVKLGDRNKKKKSMIVLTARGKNQGRTECVKVIKPTENADKRTQEAESH